MSGTTRTSADLDVRRRRILFRAWHRGIREMDLILGRFADAHIGDMSEAEVDEFEHLIDAPDHDVFAWISGERPVPEAYDTPVYRRVKAFHTHGAPIHV
ncbi:succinate dehydrogenase assembly factor 2 [Chelatococcus sp. SYSU_G07232]|uniref:FAD assembly factor SdhE n=1 Tax=Chelatococcus albus TaxID=3047466 RepID=A0ABT7ADL0_9HYPH|nr:succinate dehydrogenase assembly factor 2 [Chelatococcus sp. SYSU_G07232]MDJ1156879.1 succinate dehydrogenase assembly factor 2 [Chelatococcus sp. SYSU_G07232]